jgi:hypothetical protein
MRLEHKGLGVSVELLDELLQRHVEAYFVALRELGGEDYLNSSTPERSGYWVRAGCRSGILNSLSEEDVSGMKPAAVMWLSAKLDEHIASAMEIPPE